MNNTPDNIVNKAPFLRGSREFPQDPRQLTQEVNKSYLEIAQAVNQRSIGTFPATRPAITGNTWYIKGGKSQFTLRQVYLLGNSFTAIDHNINTSRIGGFAYISGTFTDGTNWYPLPYVDPTAANQIGIIITPTQITFTVGGAAPSITSGFVVLEYLSL